MAYRPSQGKHREASNGKHAAAHAGGTPAASHRAIQGTWEPKHGLEATARPVRPLVLAAVLASTTVIGLALAGAESTSTPPVSAISGRIDAGIAPAASRSSERAPLADRGAGVSSAADARSAAGAPLADKGAGVPVEPSETAMSTGVVDGTWSLSDEDLKVPYSKSPAEKAQDLMAGQTAKDIEELKAKGEGTIVTGGDLTLTADVVRELNKQYAGKEPAGWNAGHATGDIGNAYEFSQCTWWAYKRRHELGLPAGSHMGDGRMWTSTGKSLGYWVSNEPHIGDAVSFPAGVMGSDPYYGHVAIVENVFEYEGKKYIKTSESGASFNGSHFSRIIGDPERFEYLHY